MTMDEVDGVAEVPCMTVDEVDCMVEVPVSIPSSVHGFLPLRGSVLDFLLGGPPLSTRFLLLSAILLRKYAVALVRNEALVQQVNRFFW